MIDALGSSLLLCTLDHPFSKAWAWRSDHAGVLDRSRVVRSARMAILRSALGRGGIFSLPDQSTTKADDAGSCI